MVIGTSVRIDHTDFYCSGQGQRCTLTHYTSKLKQHGLGQWRIEHETKGIAIVLRTG